ncbi:MAG TPA: hypothetical protein VH277_01390 [Gemmatimonadaceae bacterium]|jgi:hypothetical protein|nr:hypothetical protein [Gemmatimonadaceae bacterium]
MRVGDFGVEIVAVDNGQVREIESGHVLARAGTVYGIRLRNFGPLRCVADVRIDGKPVTGGGLVIDAYAATVLERPVDARDAGRFTVIAEGDERVFGPDGGRDNLALGCIEARFRRELPRNASYRSSMPSDLPSLPLPTPSRGPRDPFDPFDPPVPSPPPRPMAPPEWNPPGMRANSARPITFSALSHPGAPAPEVEVVRDEPRDIERAAGTGLTGHSTQEFVPIAIGPLEQEATTIQLRIVIGTDDAFRSPRRLAEPASAPARPPARP